MLKELRIDGYRGFESFEMTGLAQVNLVVGRNSSGKTALLEAIELLSSPGYPVRPLLAPLRRRDENFPDEEGSMPRKIEYDMGHLFYGHKLSIGSSFAVDANTSIGYDFVRATILAPDIESQRTLFADYSSEEDDFHGWSLALSLESSMNHDPLVLPLTSRGGLSRGVLLPPPERPVSDETSRKTTFLTTDSFTSQEVAQSWTSIVLTEDEDMVIQALRILDDNIERVAFVGTSRGHARNGRGGLLVKYKDSDPIPIGSLGDGMWRMFCIAVALIRSRGGILLVDEIDTGLHYSTMHEMWSLVLQTAARLDTQVFATTHSSDCID
ncbi:MAG: AAA family ATPase, partial [bacterium]|nr:AAA family ATPase [bacterium]